MAEQWTLPVARLCNAVQNDLSSHLLFPVSHEPTSSTDAAASSAPSAAQQAPVVQALLGALTQVDTSFLKPISPEASVQPFGPQPGSLQAALLSLDRNAFAVNLPGPHIVATSVPSQGTRVRNAAPTPSFQPVQCPPAQQQQQQQPTAKAPAQAAPVLTKRQSLSRRPSEADAAAGTAQERKRRRRHVDDGEEELYVPKGLDTSQIAGQAGKAVADFLQRVHASDGDGNDAEQSQDSAQHEGDINMADAAVQAAYKRRPLIRSLNEQLAQAKAANGTAQLEVGQLRQLLLLLRPLVALGADRMVADDDEMDAPAAVASLCALEAATCCLQVLSAPGLASELYMQELLDACMACIKYQLQYNVLVFHDMRHRRLYRPTTLQDDPASPKPKKGASASKAAAMALKPPRCAAALRGHVERCLSLLSEVVGQVQVETEALLPLLRIAMGALNIEGVLVLQAAATSLAVSVFRHYKGLRSSIMDEFLSTVLLDMGAHSGKAPPRCCLVAEHGGLHIQMAVALVLQLIEAAAELMPVDAESAQVAGCFSASVAWADRLWAAVFDRLPHARAQKSDTSLDFKAVVEHMVTGNCTKGCCFGCCGVRQHCTAGHRQHSSSCYSKPACVFPAFQMTAACATGRCPIADHVAHMQVACNTTPFPCTRSCCAPDMLNVQMLPEWPSANTALRRFLKALCSERGLRHPDNAVKLMCIDFAGLLAGRLCTEALTAEDEAALVADMVNAAASMPEYAGLDTGDLLHQLLLGVLQHLPQPHATSARRFIVCRMLYERLQELQQQQGGEASADQVTALLVAHRQLYDRQQSSLGASSSGAAAALDPRHAPKLARRLVMDGFLGRACTQLLMLLADAGDRSRQDANAAQVRAKAIKALASVIESDPRALTMLEVKAGVRSALADDAVSVREAALDLLGKYISSNVRFAEQYFDVLCAAVQDNGLSVRKRAVKTLWDCCVRCAGFSRTPEAVVAILQRVVDQEESMRGLVTKICSQLWFSASAVAAPADAGAVERRASQRASDLARVALLLYEAGGKAIHVPLPADHALLMVMKEALGEGAPEGAREVAEALLEQTLALQAETDASSTAQGGIFPHLLSLHALSAAQPALCMPDADPLRFVRCLTPYLTPAAPTDKGRSADEQRRAAEETLCLLSIVNALAGSLGHLDVELAGQLMRDLASMISTHSFVQVIAGACQCLCSLSALQPELAARQVSQLVTRCVRLVELALPEAESADSPAAQTPPPNPAHMNHVPRFLFLLGQLCRYGAAIIDGAAAAAAASAPSAATSPTPGPPPPTTRQLCDLLIRAYRAQNVPPKVQEAALHALGLLSVARPELMMECKEALDILEAALGQHAPVALRTRGLTNLVELLRGEEEGMLARQRAAEAAAEAKQVASTLARSDSKSLAKQNGEGDGSSLTSAILQRMWAQVLSISTGVMQPQQQPLTTPPKTPSLANPAADAAAAMRRKALELIEVTLRGGLVAPWTAIPSLVALLTDSSPDTKARALRVLKGAIDKYPDYVGTQLSPAGIAGAYDFQRRQWEAAHPGQPLPKAPSEDALRGMAAMYSEVVQPDTKLRARFLSSLLKPFDDASCLASGGAVAADAHALAFCVHAAAALPYRRADEPLMLLHAINGVVSRHGHDVLDRLCKALRAAGLSSKLAAGDDDAEDNEASAGERAVANGSAVGRDVHMANGGAKAANGAGVGRAGVDAPLRASLALSMLLVLKQWLLAAYGLSDERVAAFELKGERRRVEEKALVSRSAKVPAFGLAVVNLRSLEDATGALLMQQCAVFGGLLDNDAANYKQAAVIAHLDGMECDGDAAEQGVLPAHPVTPAAGLVVFQTTAKKPPKGGATTGHSKRARSAGGKGLKGGAKARGSTAKRKKAARKLESDTDDAEDDPDVDVDVKPTYRG